MNDFPALFRRAIAELARADPSHRRFGAKHHRYTMSPPIVAQRLAELETTLEEPLPAPYREFLTQVGDGGAGPYHGLLPFDHPRQQALAQGRCSLPADAASSPALRTWSGVVALSHLGCDQAALLVVSGPARGTVWLDARAADQGVLVIADSFHQFVAEWMGAVAADRWPRAWVAPGACPLALSLSAYLEATEQRLQVEPGQLGDADLRAALEAIPPRGIHIAATGESPLFALGEGVDPCVACEQMLQELATHGLSREAVAPGVVPRPLRPD